MPIIILIFLGYFLRLRGFFDDKFLKIGNKTVFNVLLPALLFKNIFDIEDMSEIRMDVVGYCLLIEALLILVGWAMTLFVRDPEQKGVVHQCVFRSNFALIGVPLAELIGGAGGVRIAAILSMFTIPLFNVMAVIVLSVYKNGSARINPGKLLGDIIRNPLIIGVVLGLLGALLKNVLLPAQTVAYFGQLTFVYTAISYLARAATPIALLVLGGQFDFNQISGYKNQLTLGVIGRNLIAPICGIGIGAMLTISGTASFGPEAMAAIIALFATPVAVSSAIMAEAMGNDGKLAGQLVVWTSILSMLSLAASIALCRGFGLL